MGDDADLVTSTKQKAITVTFVSDNDIPNIVESLSDINRKSMETNLTFLLTIYSYSILITIPFV